jgi:hypothetical protein
MHAAAPVAAVGDAAGDAAAHGHEGHVAPAAVQDAAPTHGEDGGHACQCLGSGCCAAGVLAPTVQAVRWRVLVARRADPPAPAPAVLAQAPAPRLLPYANGPPGPA